MLHNIVEAAMTRRFAPASVPAAEPISELNTTPLIDVMLVLLVMFIITVPIATHKVAIDTPSGPPPIVEPEIHLLDVDVAGRVYWDGARIAEAQLPARLTAMRAAGPEAVLHFRADGETRYEDFDRVLAAVKRAGVERLGLIGNERFAAAAAAR
jgi:biopolymer transport protein ExbD